VQRTSGAVVGIVFALAVGFVGGSRIASAHADLVSAEPAVDAKERQPPATLVLHFSQGIKHEGSFILIEDADGTRLPLTVSFDENDATVMRGTPDSPLQPGVYKVLWQTLSADDDDFDDGSYRLTVLNPDGSDPEGPTSSVEPDEKGGSSGDTIILVAVAIAVVVAVGGIAYYINANKPGGTR
jgi:methionine-rich copper-binding protein CopC